jgi:uncharacterized protein YndB with AHSA1/START domain
MGTTSKTKNEQLELLITRTFDAPLDVVWMAWTGAEHARAWGPKGFTTPEREMEFFKGGKWYALMISPDGKEFRQHGIVQEVIPRERLAFTFMWDEHPDEQMLVEINFAARGDKTEMVFRQTGFNSEGSRDGHRGGWNEAFDNLAAHLPSVRV